MTSFDSHKAYDASVRAHIEEIGGANTHEGRVAMLGAHMQNWLFREAEAGATVGEISTGYLFAVSGGLAIIAENLRLNGLLHTPDPNQFLRAFTNDLLAQTIHLLERSDSADKYTSTIKGKANG